MTSYGQQTQCKYMILHILSIFSCNFGKIKKWRTVIAHPRYLAGHHCLVEQDFFVVDFYLHIFNFN